MYVRIRRWRVSIQTRHLYLHAGKYLRPKDGGQNLALVASPLEPSARSADQSTRENMEERVLLRCTVEEKAAWRKAAAEQGVGLSAWFRGFANDEVAIYNARAKAHGD